VTAIYRFARTADDIADEGQASAAQRLAELDRYQQALDACAQGRIGSDWAEVFGPLSHQIERHALPVALLADLLSAFKQDTANPIYPDRTMLLDYCARSANPIGRLLLHLAGVNGRDALAQSDAICSALQLINFWQDLSIDLARGRCYVPLADARRHGLELPLPAGDSEATRALVRELVGWARSTMAQGAALVHGLPGRFGWELRLVVQGGLRVLDKIEASGCNALTHRPVIGAVDAPRIAWRAVRMRRAATPALAAGGAAR
jgi:squalene synthase HpnC